MVNVTSGAGGRRRRPVASPSLRCAAPQALLESMVDAAESLCPHVMKKAHVRQDLILAGSEKLSVPRAFVKNVLLEQSGVDILNKIRWAPARPPARRGSCWGRALSQGSGPFPARALPVAGSSPCGAGRRQPVHGSHRGCFFSSSRL